MRFERTPNKEKPKELLYFQDVKGKELIAGHPVIMGSEERDVEYRYRSHDNVKCVWKNEEETMSFDDYLAIMRVSYGEYFKKLKSEKDKTQAEILKELHQGKIDERTAKAITKNKEYTKEEARRDNLQQETAKDHSPLFAKTFNDLGIDGLKAEGSLPRSDYLDEIDDYLVLDSKSLETNGEQEGKEIYIGIQRSFSEKKVKRPVELIPEQIDRGPIFKVTVIEKLDEYMDENEETYWQKLLNMRTAKAKEVSMSPDQYAKTQRNEGLSAIAKVLPGGEKQQIAKVQTVLETVRNQLKIYLHSLEFSNLPPRIQRILKENGQEIKISNFIAAAEDLKQEKIAA